MRSAIVVIVATSMVSGFANAQPLLFEELRDLVDLGRPYSTSVRLFDADGDTDLDAYLGDGGVCDSGGCRPGVDQFLVNDGTGRFTESPGRIPTSAYSAGVAVLDVDLDGALDLVVGNANAMQPGDRILRNDGRGFFQDERARLPVWSEPTRAVVAGDVDGDGDGDLLFGKTPGVRLARNDGFGLFLDATQDLPPSMTPVGAIALVDLDADRALDVVLGCDGENHVWINDGRGRFTELVGALPPDVATTRSVCVADFDGDQDPDVYFGNVFAQDRYLVNDGTGRFVDGTAGLPVLDDVTSAVGCADFDADGDLDLIVARDQRALLLLWNDGRGRFTPSTIQTPPGAMEPNDLALGDVDADGDLDVLLACGAIAFPHFDPRDRLFLNVTTQLTYRDPPSLGRTFAIDLRAGPGDAWSLAGAPLEAFLPLPPVGILHLDPLTLVALAAGGMDANGRSRWTVAVPADPALLGAPFVFQGLMAFPVRLSSFERVFVERAP